jgi:hypothetical protein
MDRPVAPLEHIILIPRQPVFALSPSCCVLSAEATHINLFIVFGLTRLRLEPTIYHSLGEHTNHYTTDEPTIYRSLGKHINHYTTDAVMW